MYIYLSIYLSIYLYIYVYIYRYRYRYMKYVCVSRISCVHAAMGQCACPCISRARSVVRVSPCGSHPESVALVYTLAGKTRMAKAKFSYVYRRKQGHPGLLIATHNSGITPEGIVEM